MSGQKHIRINRKSCLLIKIEILGSKNQECRKKYWIYLFHSFSFLLFKSIIWKLMILKKGQIEVIIIVQYIIESILIVNMDLKCKCFIKKSALLKLLKISGALSKIKSVSFNFFGCSCEINII